MQSHDLSYEHYDALVQDSMRQVIDENNKIFKYNIWHGEEIRYQQERDRFLKDLDSLKGRMFSLLNKYLAERKNPNENSRKLLNQIFTSIQSIENPETGAEAYITIRDMFLHSSGSCNDRNSPTLCRYSKRVEGELAHYFHFNTHYRHASEGTCIKHSMNVLLWRSEKDIKSANARLEKKLHAFISEHLQGKYNEVLDLHEQFKKRSQILDNILMLSEQFYIAMKECQPLGYYKCRDKDKEIYEANLQRYFIQEAKWWYDDDPWTRESKESIEESAQALRKEDYKHYVIAYPKAAYAKRIVLEAIKPILDNSQIIYDSKDLYGISDIEPALCALRQQLTQNIAQEHACFFETQPNQVCKRLAILLEKEAYTSFIGNLCAEIHTRFGISESEKKTLEDKEEKPLSTVDDDEFVLVNKNNNMETTTIFARSKEKNPVFSFSNLMGKAVYNMKKPPDPDDSATNTSSNML